MKAYSRRAGSSVAPDWLGCVESTLEKRAAAVEPGSVNIADVVAALDVLERLSPDVPTVIATVLWPFSRGAENLSCDLRDEQLTGAVDELLQQLNTLRYFEQHYLPDDDSRAEGLRQLLMALVADVRVVLIALAWQVARLRAAFDKDEVVQRQLARETRMIHAPLANRLGIWQLKWELEDLSLRFLEPSAYRRISRLVAEKRSDRQSFIEKFMAELRHLVAEAGMESEVSGRVKHIYSIWRKMQNKGLDFHELFDIRAVRVMVDTVEQCYSVLGLVHTRWQPVPGEFDDYITNPKANLYQSLHTAVTTRNGQVVEVQIRTHDMHRHAELGVAAHWRYKEGGTRDESMEKRIGVMRQLLENKAGDGDNEALLEGFDNLTTEDRVYVLTPQGDVRNLSAGATPLDFAYLVHTEVGHRCRGARVNGRIVPLTYRLKNGDRVEILTAREARPSRDWLVASLGYTGTARARTKIRHWFRQSNRDENLAEGRQAVEAEFRRLDLDPADVEKVAAKFNAPSPDELYVSVGAGDLTATQVAQAVERLEHKAREDKAGIAVHSLPAREESGDGDVRIEGLGSLMHQMARCCQPLPGDAIGGYITRGRGVSIHRLECKQFANLQRRSPERILEVKWGSGQQRRYPSRIVVHAWDRNSLIKDIGALMASENVNVTAMSADQTNGGEEVSIKLTVQVEDFDQLASLLSRLQNIPAVTDARRIR
ncbi:MAG TPA: RelA/SpoT family protein [Wenzhouxiangella sp.]|nr:RelA/SpoT family protein [Wenzhouxiangella sp.]